jgi:hypothetical protein
LFAEIVKKMIDRAKELGPNPYRTRLGQEIKKEGNTDDNGK